MNTLFLESAVVGSRNHVTIIEIPERICEMRSGGIASIGQVGLHINAISIEFVGQGYTYTVQVYAALAEQRMNEIICCRCEIIFVRSRPVRFGQFTSDIDFDIVIVGMYQKFQITLIH